MANWNSLILTNLGKELNAKINAGLTTLRFNRVALGSGTPTSSTITALSKEEQSFPFDVNPPKVKGRVMTLEFTAHNKDLVKQYTIRELGLFAQDPERGSILFAYMTDDAPDIMPARGAATVVTRKMNLNITTDNTGSVSVTTTGKFITIEDLNTHNTSSSAHADIRAKITSDINAHNSSNSAHADIRAKITSDINAHNSSNSAHADIRAKITSDINAHNSSNSAHADIRAKITSDINAHNSSGTSHADIRQLFKNYLPLTGGTVTGRLHVNDLVSTGNDTMQFSNFIQTSQAGKAYLATGKSASESWFNIDGYFNNPEKSNIGVLKRNANGDVIARAYLLHNDNKTYFPNEVYASNKLLATKEYVDSKKWGSTTIADGAVTPTKLDRAYLPLTGGTVTGRLHVNDLVSTGNDTMQFSNFIQTSQAGKAYLATGKSASESWFNIDGYFNNPEKSNIGVLKRNANGDVIARAYLLHNDNKTYFPNEVYASNKLLATKEYVDSKKWGSTTIADGAVTPTKLDRAYLPLTGGTLTGSLSIDGGNNIVHYIGPGGGTAGGNLNLGNATKTKSTSLCCINRPMWWNNTSARNLALEEDVNTHNASSSAHADIRTKITSDINAHNSSNSAHADIRAKITSDINAHNSSGTSHADIRAKITSDINAHNSSNSAHADIRAKITSDINAHNSSNSAHADIRAKITSDINAHNSSRSAHAPITDQIKAILGNTNWQDNPAATIKEITDKLGFGGVVAQRIGTNGFIKFASGLTIQWGVQKETFETTKDGTEYKCTLPIAFQNKPLIAIGGIQGDDKVNHYTYVNVQHFPANDTNSTVSFYCYRDWDWSSTKFRLAYFTIGV